MLTSHAQNVAIHIAIFPEQVELIQLCAELVTSNNGGNMYLHDQIIKAVLPLIKQHDLELIDLIGEMNHAAWELSVLNKNGIEKLAAELEAAQ